MKSFPSRVHIWAKPAHTQGLHLFFILLSVHGESGDSLFALVTRFVEGRFDTRGKAVIPHGGRRNALDDNVGFVWLACC